jgi:hypothetical protein
VLGVGAGVFLNDKHRAPSERGAESSEVCVDNSTLLSGRRGQLLVTTYLFVRHMQ